VYFPPANGSRIVSNAVFVFVVVVVVVVVVFVVVVVVVLVVHTKAFSYHNPSSLNFV